MEAPIDIDLELRFGECNGFMHVDIYDNDQLIKSIRNSTPHVLQKVNFKICFPNRLIFVTSNKDMNYDTKLNDNGKIIADKFAELTFLSIGKMSVHPLVLRDICVFNTANNETYQNTFWHTNGVITIDLDEKSFTLWHLKKLYQQSKIITNP
jgi:hypothetical protein